MVNQAKLEEVRKIILSLLLARKGATPVTILERDYYEMEQTRIPCRQFGHADVVGFLQSMPEYFIVEQFNGGHYVHGIASEKSKHVSSLVARQKIDHNKLRRPPSYSRQPQFSRRVPHMKSQRVKIAFDKLFYLMQHIKSHPDGVSIQNALLFVQRQVPFIEVSAHDLQEQLRELQHELFINGNMIYPIRNSSIMQDNIVYQQPLTPEPSTLEPSVPEPRNNSEPQSKSESPPTTQTIYPAGYEESDWIEDHFNDESDFLTAGCSSAGNYQKRVKTSEYLATNFAKGKQTDTTDYNKVNNDDDMESDDEYFAIMHSRSNGEMTNGEYPNISEIVSDRTQSRLEQLLQKHPEGIWCAELPDIYLQEYKVRLNYTGLGFASVREFTSQLPKIFYMTQVNKTDDFILYSADRRPTVPQTEPIEMMQASYKRYDEHSTVQTQCSHDEDDAPIPSDVSPTITTRFAPNDVMNYNDNVPDILVTELQQRSKKYLEVYVIEIFTPSFFWIHLRENTKRFRRMMDDLSDFYQHNKEMYNIAKIALKKGMHCACVFSGSWHRGIIKVVNADFRAKVFFYDYGTVKAYEPEDIYYLHKKFSYLPAQAIPCGLYNVKPIVGDRWKKSATVRFIEKVNETVLAATIKTIDPMYNSMMVILTDTSEEEDVHINDWLLKEKLAQVGQTADTVDMVGIMKYVVNSFNQLPTYCYAEENLMPDNCCKATSTEEKHEVPLVSPGHLCCDNHQQQSVTQPATLPVTQPATQPVTQPATQPVTQPVRPPPGFAPLGEQYAPSNASTRSFHNGYSFANGSNAKTSVFGDAEATTNPFLTDPNDAAEQMFMSIWNENMRLQIRLMDMFYDVLKYSQFNKIIFNDHMTIQIHLNKTLKILGEVLLELSQENDRSTIVDTPSASNLANGTTLNDVYSAQKTPHNSNSETLTNQDINANIFSTSNPFGVKGGDKLPNHTAFPTCADDFTFRGPWSESDEQSPRVQMPPPTIPNLASSIFDINHASTANAFASTANAFASTANAFAPNVSQGGENVPLMKPVSPAVSTNPNIPNNFSEFLDSVNNQFASMLKDTNPFKFSMTNGTQVPETQNEQTAYNYGASTASYLAARNPQSHAPNTETANIYARSNCFTPAEYVSVSSSENYTPRIVYESGPVMYNTQKKQADTDARQNTRGSSDLSARNASLELGQRAKKPPSQPVNDIATSHMQHKAKINPTIARDNSQIDENYVARPSTVDYTQVLQLRTNSGPSYYQQNGQANNLRPTPSQAWTQVQFPEGWPNSQFPNSVPFSNHSESTAFGTSTTLPRQDWNCDNGRESVPRKIVGATDSGYTFKSEDGHDKERPDIYANIWYNAENGSVEHKNATCNISPFVFQKIDVVKGVTFIFNIGQDGWMLTHEFVETFTNFQFFSRLLAMLEALNIKVSFKEIQRSEYPIQFSQLDRYPLNVPRDSERRIISINLISLQTALALLRKLKIVSREEIDNAFKKNEFLDGSVLPRMWVLIVSYRDLKRRIQLCSNYI